jgi:carboxypeptidase C (cathepsin A)
MGIIKIGLSLIAASALAVSSYAARTCTITNHLVSSLPFWDTKVPFPCNYAGAFPVSATGADQHHLFYWLFKNLTIADDAPVILWMNGGPGATSMFGLFLENGPLRVLQTGEDNFNVDLKPGGSWADIADIIFLDQPAGVGFSYYDKQPCTSMECGAIEAVQLLKQILGMYPEYKGRPLIVSGESYAGKYVPHIARKCQEEAAKDPNFFKLVGIMLGDPLANPIP